ncbi:transcription termination factor 4, mitochondrial [Callorhinchus milii]|nr:transcription termination factor 4, mitochondrial [Callorhinchus milii]XP_042195326.1 transcription termination factor 4, mitochondrial [Callorhinchus milii]
MSQDSCSPLKGTRRETEFHFSKLEVLEDLQHFADTSFPKPGLDDSESESIIKSVLELGFSDAQVKELFTGLTVKSLQKMLPVLHVFGDLGLKPSTTLKILGKCPQLSSATESQLQSRIDNLRKNGLGEGSMQRVFAHYPQILTLSVKHLNNTVRFFKTKCLFTGQQVTEILRTSPNVLFEELGDLEYKFQYAYFRMGIKQAEIMKSVTFRTSLEELKQRHIFLERLGRYQTPDKKGQTQMLNPKLKEVLHISEDYFLAKVAMSTREEFAIFKKLLSREEPETKEREELNWEDSEESSEDEYSSDEDKR